MFSDAPLLKEVVSGKNLAAIEELGQKTPGAIIQSKRRSLKKWKEKVASRKQNFMEGIKDKVVVITGASGGIGEAT
jgi:FlaA1/EpsC-like NDP-sugar epimerase